MPLMKSGNARAKDSFTDPDYKEAENPQAHKYTHDPETKKCIHCGYGLAAHRDNGTGMVRGNKFTAYDGLKPIPVDDQVLGEGAVGDGELRPIPVNDTEWNDPKARGSYKLTTSAALRTPAAVAEAYGKKDPEGMKRSFGKDAAHSRAELEDYLKRQEQRLKETASVAMKAEVRKGIELAKTELKKLGAKDLVPIPVGKAKDSKVSKLLKDIRVTWAQRDYGECMDLCQDAINAGAEGEDLREAQQYGEACKRKAAVKSKDADLEPIPVGDGAFKKLEGKLSHEKGVTDPAALAASIGRKKYGAAGMAKKSAAARDSEPSIGKNIAGYYFKLKGEVYGGYPTRAEALREYKVETAGRAKDAEGKKPVWQADSPNQEKLNGLHREMNTLGYKYKYSAGTGKEMQHHYAANGTPGVVIYERKNGNHGAGKGSVADAVPANDCCYFVTT